MALSISDAEAEEGNTLCFEVSIDQIAATDVTVDWMMVFDNGALVDDLPPGMPLSGTLTMRAGDTTAGLKIPIFDDDLVEATETFRIELKNPSANAVISDGGGTGTIIDNEAPPPPELRIADGPDQAEGDAGTTLFSFTVTRSGDLSGESSAMWAVTGIGAGPANPADVVGGVFPSGTVTFPAGADTASLEVEV